MRMFLSPWFQLTRRVYNGSRVDDEYFDRIEENIYGTFAYSRAHTGIDADANANANANANADASDNNPINNDVAYVLDIHRQVYTELLTFWSFLDRMANIDYVYARMYPYEFRFECEEHLIAPMHNDDNAGAIKQLLTKHGIKPIAASFESMKQNWAAHTTARSRFYLA